MTFSTSASPLSSYASGEAPLEELTEAFGPQLENLDRDSKFLLLASIALYAAVDNDDLYSLEDCYHSVALVDMNPALRDMLPQLGALCADNLLGLCEALVAQLRYTREA